MSKAGETVSQSLKPRDRIIVALDVGTAVEAREITGELKGRVGAFKIGLQLFTATGPGLVRELADAGNRIFLDLKFHDIPNTVSKASVEAAKLGVWMFNMHIQGGSRMMIQAVAEVDEVCCQAKIDRPLMIGVTVLTSSDEETLNETGIAGPVNKQVARLARLAAESGLNGIVASAQEVPEIRRAISVPGFLAITPGIRINPATGDDQMRVTTLRDAIANVSDYVVIGRPITQALDMRAAVDELISDVSTAHND